MPEDGGLADLENSPSLVVQLAHRSRIEQLLLAHETLIPSRIQVLTTDSPGPSSGNDGGLLARGWQRSDSEVERAKDSLLGGNGGVCKADFEKPHVNRDNLFGQISLYGLVVKTKGT